MSRRVIDDRTAVWACRGMGRACTAREIADYIGGTDSRAVATAMRKPVKDGRVKQTYGRERGIATYRFNRVKPKTNPPAAGEDGNGNP